MSIVLATFTYSARNPIGLVDVGGLKLKVGQEREKLSDPSYTGTRLVRILITWGQLQFYVLPVTVTADQGAFVFFCFVAVLLLSSARDRNVTSQKDALHSHE